MANSAAVVATKRVGVVTASVARLRANSAVTASAVKVAVNVEVAAMKHVGAGTANVVKVPASSAVTHAKHAAASPGLMASRVNRAKSVSHASPVKCASRVRHVLRARVNAAGGANDVMAKADRLSQKLPTSPPCKRVQRFLQAPMRHR